MNGLISQAYGLLIGVALAAAGIQVNPGALTTRAVVNSGHRGAVLDLAEDSGRGLLFSVGEDGFLRVWDSRSGTLVRRIAVTRQKAQSVALDPTAPLAAVLVTDGVRSFAVDVWDWDAEKRLYSFPLQSEPLFVRFSQSGTYLLCGDTRWKSLHILHALDGSSLPFHPEGFGMVGFAEASRSDVTLMTYQPAGKVDYWDFSTGNLIKEVPTVTDLVDVHMSDDHSSLVGQSGPEIVCVDAVSGETRFRLAAPGISSFDISGEAEQVACLFPDGSLQLQNPAGAALSSPLISGRFDWLPRVVRMTPEGLLLAGDDGQIGVLSGDGRATEFARDILAQVSGIAGRDNILAIAAGHVIHIFALGAEGPEVNPVIESFSIANPYAGPVGLEFLNAQRLVVWNQGEGPGSLCILDLSGRRFTAPSFSFDSPLIAVVARDDTLFTLEKGGEMKVLKPATGEQLFQSRWPGAVCIAPLGASSLVFGRLSGGPLGASLVRVDLRTGETAPLPGSTTFTFALAADPGSEKLYSLGVGPDGHTSLTLYSGKGLQTETVVDSADGEYLSGALSFDPENHFLYTSLGREVVKAWTGGALESLGDSSRETLALCALNGHLASLERDSSVSIWDTAADRPFGEIYPFADANWAAVMADGTILGSPGGQKKVGILVGGHLWEKGEKTAPTLSQEKPPSP